MSFNQVWFITIILLLLLFWYYVWFMLFYATLSNISDMSWWSVLLVEGTGGPGDNPRLVVSH